MQYAPVLCLVHDWDEWRCGQLATFDDWKQYRVEHLLPHKRDRQAHPFRNHRSRQAFHNVQTRRECSRQHKLAREDIRMQFTALARAVILDTLQADRCGFDRLRGINVIIHASVRFGMKDIVADLVRHEERPIRFRAVARTEDRAGLIIEKRTRAF
jgi:hypothetical protein